MKAKTFWSYVTKFQSFIPKLNILINPYEYWTSLFPTQSRLLTPLEKKPLDNIVGKGDAGNQYFLLFPQFFSIHPKKNFCF